MRIIGITGGIGSGKSKVLDLLRGQYSAYVIETDLLAHELMLPGQNAYKSILAHFGDTILLENGEIDRAKLGAIVFNDSEQLEQLNGIVHPAVKQYIISDIADKKKNGDVPYYVIEAALLIEDGYKAICDELWYVYVSKEERIQRLLEGRGGTIQKWESVMMNQAPEDYYMEHCNYTIDNNDSFEKTANIVNEILSYTK